MNRILLVDDDAELREMLSDYLVGEGCEVGTAADGESGVPMALSGEYALVVLDVMMPGMGGIEALKRIRAESGLPVVMLTAKGEDMDRIVGLELGADDYVPKPCMPRELVARVRAILRRANGAERIEDDGDEAIIVGALSLWPAKRLAEWNGSPLDLTSTEFNLLEQLARHAGQPVSKQILSERGLSRPLNQFDRAVDVHMSSIRRKLGCTSDGRNYIQTVFRRGYLLVKE